MTAFTDITSFRSVDHVCDTAREIIRECVEARFETRPNPFEVRPLTEQLQGLADAIGHEGVLRALCQPGMREALTGLDVGCLCGSGRSKVLGYDEAGLYVVSEQYRPGVFAVRWVSPYNCDDAKLEDIMPRLSCLKTLADAKGDYRPTIHPDDAGHILFAKKYDHAVKRHNMYVLATSSKKKPSWPGLEAAKLSADAAQVEADRRNTALSARAAVKRVQANIKNNKVTGPIGEHKRILNADPSTAFKHEGNLYVRVGARGKWIVIFQRSLSQSYGRSIGCFARVECGTANLQPSK